MSSRIPERYDQNRIVDRAPPLHRVAFHKRNSQIVGEVQLHVGMHSVHFRREPTRQLVAVKVESFQFGHVPDRGRKASFQVVLSHV